MRGFSFIEVLVGTALILTVFLGIYGAYQLGLKIIGKSKARILATALANQKIELARNLSYANVGTVGGIPPGVIPENEAIIRNNINYDVKTTVGYIDDIFDATAPDDLIPNDYKRVKVKVSWPGIFGGEVVLITDIAPKGLETSVGGGNLLIKVFSATGLPVSQADIHIVNSSTTPPIDANYQTNDEGQYLAAGAPSSVENYKITVSKSGYSAERTYGADEVTNPLKPHATVIEGKLTQISFSIDKLSGFSIKTLSPTGVESFADSFADESKISEATNISILNGRAELATTSDGYLSSGSLMSQAIAPSDLMSWKDFSWNDSEPDQTDLKYRVFYATTTDWFLIPQGDLPGNLTGFDSSPVDISGLSTTTYFKIKLKADFSTSEASSTPSLFDWQISWQTDVPVPIPNVSFSLKGEKIVGADINDGPVYKYSQNHSSNSQGAINIQNLEWDSYTFSVDRTATGLNLIETNPSPQPINLFPDSNQTVDLFLQAENSLLIKVKDLETASPIFSAQIRLSNLSGYDQTFYTNEKGEALFIPLETGSYNYEIQASGYQDKSGSVSVSGDDTLIINLTPGEI